MRTRHFIDKLWIDSIMVQRRKGFFCPLWTHICCCISAPCPKICCMWGSSPGSWMKSISVHTKIFRFSGTSCDMKWDKSSYSFENVMPRVIQYTRKSSWHDKFQFVKWWAAIVLEYARSNKMHTNPDIKLALKGWWQIVVSGFYPLAVMSLIYFSGTHMRMAPISRLVEAGTSCVT